jgi:hypothetical protein
VANFQDREKNMSTLLFLLADFSLKHSITRSSQDLLSVGQGFSSDSRTTCPTERSTNAVNEAFCRVNTVPNELTRKKGDKMKARTFVHRHRNRVVLLQFSRQLLSGG